MPSDSNLKKIMIVAMPRTGTTVMSNYLSWKYQIPNLQEPFSDLSLGFDSINSICYNNPYQWTAGIEKAVFKLLAQNLYYIDIKKLLGQSGIDHVVLMERDNLVDCCVSIYHGKITGKYHYTKQPQGTLFECPDTWVYGWLEHYQRYMDAKQYVISTGVPYSIINYEEFLLDRLCAVNGESINLSTMIDRASISTISANLTYDTLCVNYSRVKELIETRKPWVPTYKFSY